MWKMKFSGRTFRDFFYFFFFNFLFFGFSKWKKDLKKILWDQNWLSYGPLKFETLQKDQKFKMAKNDPKS